MAIDQLHASHIRRVEVGFIISGESLNPHTVSEVLHIDPDISANRGDKRVNYLGKLLLPEIEGYWRLDTKGKVPSKDINEHLRYLLNRLLPHRDAILRLARDGEVFFDVLWQSTYLYAGTGPVIERDCLQGIAELQASIGFDIYQIDEDEKLEAGALACAEAAFLELDRRESLSK